MTTTPVWTVDPVKRPVFTLHRPLNMMLEPIIEWLAQLTDVVDAYPDPYFFDGIAIELATMEAYDSVVAAITEKYCDTGEIRHG